MLVEGSPEANRSRNHDYGYTHGDGFLTHHDALLKLTRVRAGQLRRARKRFDYNKMRSKRNPWMRRIQMSTCETSLANLN